MPKIDLYDASGAKTGEMELSEAVFGQKINKVVLHQVVVAYLANQRQGTQSTKTRTEVRGGGRKPWRQKGTGRARQGSIRSPQWRGGGITFGPKPRLVRLDVNKKVKRVAMKSALSAKVLDSEMIVLDGFNMDTIKTKEIANLIKNLNVDKKALIVMADKNDNIIKSAKNIPNVSTTLVSALNVYDILKYEKFIVLKDAVEKIEEVYA